MVMVRVIYGSSMAEGWGWVLRGGVFPELGWGDAVHFFEGEGEV